MVVPAGETASTLGLWGVIKPTVPSGISLLSPPIETDLDLNGSLGSQLASTLSAGTILYVLQPGTVNFNEFTLNGSGQWINTAGSNDPTLDAGQGFFVSNPGSSSTPRFAGTVGNDGTSANTLKIGYNLIGLSEGKNLAASSAFESATPIGNYDEESADQIVLQNADGSWRRLIRQPGGTWYDTVTRTTTTLTLTPGQAYYYIRRTSDTTVDF